MCENVLDVILREKIVVILRGIPDEKLLFTVEAILNGGAHCVEVTFVNKTRESVLHSQTQQMMLHDNFGESLRLGAGTVISVEEVLLAKEAGAEYIISPNCDAEVITKTKQESLISMPGAYTPSEICQAWKCGADLVKVFPIPAGDEAASYIRMLKGPLPHIPLVAVGGVTIENLRDVMRAGACGIGIGQAIVSSYMLMDCHRPDDYFKITENVRRFISILTE